MGCASSKSQVVVNSFNRKLNSETDEKNIDVNNNQVADLACGESGQKPGESREEKKARNDQVDGKLQFENDGEENRKKDSAPVSCILENEEEQLSSINDAHVDKVQNVAQKDGYPAPSNSVKCDDRDGLLIIAEDEEALGMKMSASDFDQNNNELEAPRREPEEVKLRKKNALFSSVDDFKDVDEHALKAPKEKLGSFQELASYLTESCTSDLYKVRSIWRWVTSNIEYDTEAFFSNNISAAADENNALRTGKAVCSGYSSLVSALCSCAALECKEVHGYAKGYNYQLGDSFKGERTNHSWTVIKIEGQWWLFDFTWGAGYVSKDRKFIWDYNEHYFMTEPELFILDHFPKDYEWQLTNKVYFIEEYEQWANFHKHFFIHRLDYHHKNGLLKTNTGEVEVTVGISVRIQISSKLELVENGTLRHLENYSFTQVIGGSARFTARLPQAGNYHFKLFASKLTKDLQKTYDIVAQYKIESTHPTLKSEKPFPKIFSSWLPGYALHEPTFGVLPIGEATKFRITAPDAMEMHVCATGAQGEWTKLEEARKGVWQGDVLFKDGTTEATVVVKVEGQISTSYTGILKYSVQGS